ncbi:hypothetical protein JCM11641_004820 [Rhodosporidiobolus odoratus]
MFKFWKTPKSSAATPSAPSTSKSPPQPHPSTPPPPLQDQPPSTSTRSAESNTVLHGLGIRSGDVTELGGTGQAEVGNCTGTRSSEGQGVERIDFALHPPAALPTTATTTTAQSRRPSGAASPDFDPPRGAGTGGSGGQLLGLERTTSPVSFAASSVTSSNVVYQSPYGAFAAAGERDPNQIHSPPTWAEMAHQELVVNLSSRERMRQEILWEVVASEERYVADLRSLIDHYANPLLHPLLSNSPTAPSPFLGASPSPLLGSTSPAFSTSSASPVPAASSPNLELPIAARFSRSTHSLPSSSGNRSPYSATQNLADLPEILDDSDSPSSSSAAPTLSTRSKGIMGGLLGRSSLPAVPPSGRAGGVRQASSSSSLDAAHPSSSHQSQGLGGRLAASLGFSAPASSHPSSSTSSRHPLRPAPSSAKLHKNASKAPQEVKAPPVLPECLKQVLESVVEMLKGHEELSRRLKERWAKDFPLVRGLAAIWSDQSWFLQTYTTYIVHLEDTLSLLDALLPSPHSSSLSSSPFHSKPKPFRKLDKTDKKLAKLLMSLEEKAADAGESGLGICLSKPLMRLGKLPLMMQALLFHTDPTTHEYEKTRAMALEVDALVRSIEDEKIEEEERERTRDILARIDGINDKALMAPRSSRVVLSEYPAPSSATSTSPDRRRRRSSIGRKEGKKDKGRNEAEDWLIQFTDVVVRVQKVGQTNIPGSFSREKEKQGKQGKTRKTGKLRNTYRFIRVDRWELHNGSDTGLTDAEAVRRDVSETGQEGRRRVLGEEGEDEEDEEEEDMDGTESRMSFSYDVDENSHPTSTSTARRAFSPVQPTRPSTTKAPAGRRGPLRSSPLAPSSANAKFGTRLRVGSEDTAGMRVTTPVPTAGRGRFDAPTVSSQLKQQQQQQQQQQAAAWGVGVGGGGGPGRRAASSPAPVSSSALPPRTVPPPTPAIHSTTAAPLGGGGRNYTRDQSTFGLYQMWASQDS